MNKILNLSNYKLIKKNQFKNKKIGMCHGVFDILHIGHIKHFEHAKKLVDILIVSVTSDEFVNKGPNRPAFSQNLRMQSIAALKDVDYVCLSNSKSAVKNLNIIKPNFYIKGKEYRSISNDLNGEIKNEIEALKKNKGKIYFTQGITSSSSKLLNKFFTNFSNDQEKFINIIKKKFSFEKIKKLINEHRNSSALVLGETIIDQYNFTEAIGKSGKEPNLVLRDIKTEEYLGGAVAIATNLAQFCKKVYLLTMLGENAEFIKEIKKKIPKNISLNFIKKKGSPTIVKKRYLDLFSKTKLFGIYKINDDILDLKQENNLNKKLENLKKKSDFIVVSDYGHGFISKKISKKISNFKKFVALNAQINANNIGYHSLKNYKNIDFVIINEKELRHELRDRSSQLKMLIKKFCKEQNIKDLVVTRGSSGATLYNSYQKKFYTSPAFADKILDKIGSGDTMLTQCAITLIKSKDRNLSLFLGSLAAAETIKNFGNKNVITKELFLKSIQHMLK
tara:strand:- start:3615 stop:5132 length:1518 start_codon:yes stop_codon:yes gene_type:complete